MPGVFISHSSKDKAFVTKLAMDLVLRDIPVWFDNWELELGDSLIQKIYNGVDESSYLLLVLSSSSVNSKWVEKELTAALAKEEQIGRRFIIPILIDRCRVPLAVADRLYGDFTDSYLNALEGLTAGLKKLKVTELEVPPEQQLVPMTFTKGIYLRETPIEKRVTSILKKAPEGFRFSENQLVISFEDTYCELRKRLIHRMENIENDPYYSPDFERSFSLYYDSFLSAEERLAKGIVLILNEGVVNKRLVSYGWSGACHWFARLVRTKTYALLYNCQNPDSKDLIALQPQWDPLPLADNDSAAKFFEVDHVTSIEFGPQKISPYVHLWVDNDWQMLKDWKEIQMPLRMRDYLSSEVLNKYIVPQMVEGYLTPPPYHLLWDFDEYYVGPS